MNPAAIHLLEANLDKIGWIGLSMNPAAIHLLEANLDRISWYELSENPAAIHLLMQHPEKIHWPWFSRNPAIFTYDYDAMRTSRTGLHEELIQNRFHPQNIRKFKDWGFETGWYEDDDE